MAVCWPFHVGRMLQGKRAIFAISLVLGFSVILNFPRWIEAQQYNGAGYLLRSEYDRNKEKGPFTTIIFIRTISGILRHRLYRKIYHGWIWVTLMYILPIPGLCFFNFKIWTQVILMKCLKSNNLLIKSNRVCLNPSPKFLAERVETESKFHGVWPAKPRSRRHGVLNEDAPVRYHVFRCLQHRKRSGCLDTDWAWLGTFGH